VGKTESGEVIELTDKVELSVVPSGIAELQSDKLLPVKNGNAKLMAKAGDVTGSVAIKINVIDDVRASCPTTPCVMHVNQDVQLSGQVMGLGGTVDSEVTWSSSADAIAKVDLKGKVNAIAPGKATITMKTAGRESTVDVEVKANVEELRLFCAFPPLFAAAKVGTTSTVKERSCEVTAGEKSKLFGEVLAGGQPAPDERLEWSSSDTSLIVVQGELTPHHAGGAIVTAKMGGTITELPVVVNAKKRGAPQCSDSDAGWTATVAGVVKSKLGEEPFESSTDLLCQSGAAPCVTAAFGEFSRVVTGFGIDKDGAARVQAFFVDETARRCCCKRK
jgi:hypothetical protein